MTTPTARLDQSDPGDETIRNYQYQAGYGVVILVACATGALDYQAIWCEQHEDLLGEVTETLFDAYQIKTRKPERGAWKSSDAEFVKSIKRFVDEDTAFPGCIRRFKFVSNAEFLISDDAKKTKFCVAPLLNRIAETASAKDLDSELATTFERLREDCNVSAEALFPVLARLDLVKGPDRNDYRDALSQSHISTLPECGPLPASTLREIVEGMIGKIMSASGLAVSSPARHYFALSDDPKTDARLLAKRVTPADLRLWISNLQSAKFRYLAELGDLPLGNAAADTHRLKEKLEKGGLAEQFEILRRQALSAEAQLLDLTTRRSTGGQILSQLQNVVLSECQKAAIRAKQGSNPYGTRMLIDVQDRLKAVAKNSPNEVYSQRDDMLVGIAALLTGQCEVWWSPPFDVRGVV